MVSDFRLEIAGLGFFQQCGCVIWVREPSDQDGSPLVSLAIEERPLSVAHLHEQARLEGFAGHGPGREGGLQFASDLSQDGFRPRFPDTVDGFDKLAFRRIPIDRRGQCRRKAERLPQSPFHGLHQAGPDSHGQAGLDHLRDHLPEGLGVGSDLSGAVVPQLNAETCGFLDGAQQRLRIDLRPGFLGLGDSPLDGRLRHLHPLPDLFVHLLDRTLELLIDSLRKVRVLSFERLPRQLEQPAACSFGVRLAQGIDQPTQEVGGIRAIRLQVEGGLHLFEPGEQLPAPFRFFDAAHSTFHFLGQHRLHVGAQILLAEDAVALAVEHFALLIEDVVVLQQVLAGVEVGSFDPALGLLDDSADNPVGDGGGIVNVEAFHQA